MNPLVSRPPESQGRPRAGRVAGALSLLLALPWGPLPAGEGISSRGVLGFDLDRLDDRGLQGPPDGLRALDYEYCIPQGVDARSEVSAIDPSARFLPGSPGRIGCGTDQVLVIGNTHQPRFRGILAALAQLPYVEQIVECVFE